jgi:glucuronate isomerase
MNTSELRKRIYKLLDRVDSQETLKRYYKYLKENTSKEKMNKLWEQFNSVYSYKGVPEDGTQEAPDFITQVEKGLK